jgi:hypothetical protein
MYHGESQWLVVSGQWIGAGAAEAADENYFPSRLLILLMIVA